MAAFVRSRLALCRLRGWAQGSTARLFLKGSFPQENHNFISRRLIMKRITVLLLVLVACFATVMQAQTPAPKPDPALKKLAVFVGHWTYEGEYKTGPLGPGGRTSGEYTGQLILAGFFYQGRWTEKGPGGESRGLEIEAYDPVNKNFVSNWYLSDGSRLSGILIASEETYAWAGDFLVAGKQYQFKDTMVLAADLLSMSDKAQISIDGKTWTSFYELKWTKVQPAAKK